VAIPLYILTIICWKTHNKSGGSSDSRDSFDVDAKPSDNEVGESENGS